MKSKTLIVIVGPTAIGKTAMAIKVAQHFNTEIISADSRQFFKETEIGTAKPSAAERKQVQHHFVDSHSVNSYFSTGDFELAAIAKLNLLFKDHQIVVMAGGSGLYVNAVCNGLDVLPDIDLNIRETLNQRLKSEGIEKLRAELRIVDPEYYEKVDIQNPQRMVRGLEFFLSTGKKLSSFLTNQPKERPFNIIKIGLNTGREILYDRINNRVDEMMHQGLLEEVKSLLPYKELNALKTVGYSELFDYLDGKMQLIEAVAMIKQNTRRFAKRQITWFKKDMATNWFEPAQDSEIIKFLDAEIQNPIS